MPYAAGGGTDAIARVIAQGMTEQLGQQLVVENNGTAGGNVATAAAAKAEPDGYTLLMANQGPMTVNPHLFKNVKIDPLTAFDPVTLIAEAPLVVVVPEDSRFTSFQAIVDEAKGNPGGLTYGSAGNGSASHLATLLLANTAGLDMVHVPYKGAGPAITDLIGGRLDFMITTLPSVVGFIDSGKAKPLAVTMQERAKRLPEVPTIAESGYPDYQAAAWYGFAVPKGTPPEIVTKLRDATVAAAKTPDVQKSLDIEGAVVIGSTPEEFGAFMRSESTALGRADRQDRHHHRLSVSSGRLCACRRGHGCVGRQQRRSRPAARQVLTEAMITSLHRRIGGERGDAERRAAPRCPASPAVPQAAGWQRAARSCWSKARMASAPCSSASSPRTVRGHRNCGTPPGGRGTRRPAVRACRAGPAPARP